MEMHPKPLKGSVGKMVKKLREVREFTSEELATEAGVDRTYISKLENKNILPSPDAFIKILVALNPPLQDARQLFETYKETKFPKWAKLEKIFYEKFEFDRDEDPYDYIDPSDLVDLK